MDRIKELKTEIIGLEELIRQAFYLDAYTIEPADIVHVYMFENDIDNYISLFVDLENKELYEETILEIGQETLTGTYKSTPAMNELIKDIFQDTFDIYNDKGDYTYIYAGTGRDFVDNALEIYCTEKEAEFIEEFYECFDMNKLAQELFYKYENDYDLFKGLNGFNGEYRYYQKS